MILVRRVLEHPSLGLVDVATPKPDLAVRWVATSELADPSPFLEGGEILLTTGISTVGWDREWLEYVDRLLLADVVALGLATGLTHEVVPAALEQACRERGLNLFEVPRPTSFVSISRLTARLLEEEAQASAEQALEVQRLLTRAARRPDDPSRLLRVLAEYAQGAAGVVTAKGSWETGPVGPGRAELDPTAVADEVRRVRPQGLRAASTRSGAEGTTVLHPLGLTGTPSSYLALWSPRPLDDRLRSATTTAVALLSLGVERRREQRATVRRLRGRAVELLVADDRRTAALVLAAAEGQSSEQIRLPRRIQVVHARGTGNALETGLAATEASGHRAMVSGLFGEELWVVARASAVRSLTETLSEAGLEVGVGREVDLEQASQSHDAARHALAQTTPSTPLVHWDDLVEHGILSLLDREAGRAFADSYLAPLGTGRSSRPELTQTLRTFLRHHGRIGPVAAELGVHRNTVRNRVAELESLLGRSLEDPHVRVHAWLALQAGSPRFP